MASQGQVDCRLTYHCCSGLLICSAVLCREGSAALNGKSGAGGLQTDSYPLRTLHWLQRPHGLLCCLLQREENSAQQRVGAT